MLDEGTEEENVKLRGAMFSDATFSMSGHEGSSAAGPSHRAAVLGDYELVKPLGQGGMGTVYLARQRTLGRLVALKTITRGSLSGHQEIARFRVEAEAAAKLDHPNIASIYEIGESAGTHYISMQFIDGESLDAWRKRTLPSPKICAAVVRDIALAMAHAHTQGVVHRDLKPGNVMIDESSTVRIVDFGLAKKLDSESQMTMTGQVMGTPSFMAPEQASGDAKNVTTLADVYAMGAILFYLLTGKPPFVGNTVYDTLDQVQHSPAPSVRSINRKLPLDLSTICAKCLEKNPAQRYASAKELADDLNRFLNHRPVLARRISRGTRALRWCRRNPLATVFMVVTTTMLSATMYLYLQADQAVANAQQSFRRQVLTINELLVQISSADLKNIPNSQAIRRDLLQKAETFYIETREASSQYQGTDDLFVQTATQLAAVQGELATTPIEREAALQKLRTAESALSGLLKAEQKTSNISIDDTLAVYGQNADARKRWESVRNSVPDNVLLNSMRESALTDNLTQQLHLLVDAPESQIEIANRILAMRSHLSSTLPEDLESKRRLAGAYHNLAEAYRKLCEETLSADDLRRSIECLELAQEARFEIMSREPSEKIRLEIAKGDFAIGSARYAARFAEVAAAPDRSATVSAQTIASSFMKAEAGFASLSNSKLYSQEALFSQAIVLRELSVLNNGDEFISDENYQLRRKQCEESCDILERLSIANPRVQKYQLELIKSQVCLYRIARFKPSADDAKTSPKPLDDSLLKAMRRDLQNANKLANEYPATFLEAYLSLVEESVVGLLEFGLTADAMQIYTEAKALIDAFGENNWSPELLQLIESIEGQLMEISL